MASEWSGDGRVGQHSAGGAGSSPNSLPTTPSARLDVIHYAGVSHAYAPDGHMVGYAVEACLIRRFASGTFEVAEELRVFGRSDADVIDCLVALSGQR